MSRLNQPWSAADRMHCIQTLKRENDIEKPGITQCTTVPADSQYRWALGPRDKNLNLGFAGVEMSQLIFLTSSAPMLCALKNDFLAPRSTGLIT